MNDTQPTFGPAEPVPVHKIEIDGLKPGSETNLARAAADEAAAAALARHTQASLAPESTTPFSTPISTEQTLRSGVEGFSPDPAAAELTPEPIDLTSPSDAVAAENRQAAVISPDQTLGEVYPPLTPLPAIEELPTNEPAPSPTILAPTDKFTVPEPTGAPTRHYSEPAPEPGKYDTPLVQPFEPTGPNAEPTEELDRAEVADKVLSIEEQRESLRARMAELDRTQKNLMDAFRRNAA